MYGFILRCIVKIQTYKNLFLLEIYLTQHYTPFSLSHSFSCEFYNNRKRHESKKKSHINKFIYFLHSLLCSDRIKLFFCFVHIEIIFSTTTLLMKRGALERNYQFPAKRLKGTLQVRKILARKSDFYTKILLFYTERKV